MEIRTHWKWRQSPAATAATGPDVAYEITIDIRAQKYISASARMP